MHSVCDAGPLVMRGLVFGNIEDRGRPTALSAKKEHQRPKTVAKSLFLTF